MSEEIGEPPGKRSDSDADYRQIWREEAKTRLLHRAQLRKQQSFPELKQKLQLLIKRENLIVQDTIKLFKYIRESKYGLPEESFSPRENTSATSTHLEGSVSNGDLQVVQPGTPYNPECDIDVADFKDTIDKVNTEIRELSIITYTEQDISPIRIETKIQDGDTLARAQSSTPGGWINKAYEGSLQSLSDTSESCSLNVDFDSEPGKQETHSTTVKTATEGGKTNLFTKAFTLEKLISKSLKNKRIAAIYLNSLPRIYKQDKTRTPKSSRKKIASCFEHSDSHQLSSAFNKRSTGSSGPRKDDLRKVETKPAWNRRQNDGRTKRAQINIISSKSRTSYRETALEGLSNLELRQRQHRLSPLNHQVDYLDSLVTR